MILTKPKFASFEEYLATEAADLPEGRFEYWDGELVEVMSESGFNDAIANYLFILLVNAGIYYELIRPHSCEVEVTGNPRSRLPDLVILEELHIPLIERRNTITRDMPAPRVVVEVMSPGNRNRDRDLIAKRQQYADRGIPEYWILDPSNQCVIILELVEVGVYREVGIFKDDEMIVSLAFPDLHLKVIQILSAGRSPDRA